MQKARRSTAIPECPGGNRPQDGRRGCPPEDGSAYGGRESSAERKMLFAGSKKRDFFSVTYICVSKVLEVDTKWVTFPSLSLIGVIFLSQLKYSPFFVLLITSPWND